MTGSARQTIPAPKSRSRGRSPRCAGIDIRHDNPVRSMARQQIFLSYSREDKARVLDLAARLRGRREPVDRQGGIDAALWGERRERARGSESTTADGNAVGRAVAQRGQGSHADERAEGQSCRSTSSRRRFPRASSTRSPASSTSSTTRAIRSSISSRSCIRSRRWASPSRALSRRRPRQPNHDPRGRPPSQLRPTTRRKRVRSPCCRSTTSAPIPRPTTSATA